MSAVPGVAEESSEQQIAARRINSVLVADDDSLFCRLLQSSLHKCNYRVTIAEDGLKAWNLLQNNDDAPQLLVLDWIMPAITGLSFADASAAASNFAIPTLFC